MIVVPVDKKPPSAAGIGRMAQPCGSFSPGALSAGRSSWCEGAETEGSGHVRSPNVGALWSRRSNGQVISFGCLTSSRTPM